MKWQYLNCDLERTALYRKKLVNRFYQLTNKLLIAFILQYGGKTSRASDKRQTTNNTFHLPMLFAEDLRLANQVRNLEVLVEGTGCKQGRLSVVICAHRQNLRADIADGTKWKEKKKKKHSTD